MRCFPGAECGFAAPYSTLRRIQERSTARKIAVGADEGVARFLPLLHGGDEDVYLLLLDGATSLDSMRAIFPSNTGAESAEGECEKR